MAQNVTVAGASYSDVPSVDLPKTGGGTASFFDLTGTTATAPDVASGKYFYTLQGVLTAGTSSGGGTGLTYEAGTYSPSTDTTQPTISFTNAHSSKPCLVLIADTTGTAQATNNSNMYWCSIDWYTAFGTQIKVGSSNYYDRRQGGYKGTSSSMSATGSNGSSDSTAYVSSSAFKPTNGSTYYFRAGRTYKWIAVWKPTT